MAETQTSEPQGLKTQGSNTQRPKVVGAAPTGATDPSSTARAVREMFTAIAPRYDVLNHVLSCNVDRLWWRRTARTFAHILSEPDSRILDLCCGTGDMTFALLKEAGRHGQQIVGADFSHAMLQRAHAERIAIRSKEKATPLRRTGSKPTRSAFLFPAHTSTC